MIEHTSNVSFWTTFSGQPRWAWTRNFAADVVFPKQIQCGRWPATVCTSGRM